MISRTGFLAGGQQQGVAFGFWGVGFSIFLPPIMSYGLFGYALYSRVTAEVFEFYPPNTPPEITQTDPTDGQQMVPMSTTELRFAIHDADDELMSYNVTTEPNIGGGSGGLKPDGVYSVPVSGLESLTTYTWYIEVSDGKDTMEKTITFTTEPAAPIISNPFPENGDRDVPMNLPQLQFTLKDYQGDSMEFTVQTSPDIGSNHKIGVHDGTYTVPLSGMTYGAEYCWYVNVTDGTYWTRKMYSFVTGYPSPFNPFEYGWQYRKEITINHTQVAGTLENFAILLNTIDVDITKAQIGGGDILFMNGAGISTKIHHEIESFNQHSGNLIAWINIPLLSDIEDLTFYMYYSNPTCVNQAYPEKTWDSNYSLVYHMNDYNNLIVKDSTGNFNDGTKYGTVKPLESLGRMGKAQYFDGYSSYILTNKNLAHGTNPLTYECWYKADSYGHSEDPYPDQYSVLFSVRPLHRTNFLICDISNRNGKDRVRTYMDNNGVNGYSYTKDLSIAFDNQWRHSIWIRDNSNATMKVYINGLSDYSTVYPLNPSYSINTNPLKIGGDEYYTDRMYFEGFIDEIRVSKIVRSPQWISTSFNSQNNPDSFLSIGTEESEP